MPTVFFVDNDPRTAEKWQQSGHNAIYSACPFTAFSVVAETAKLLIDLRPDIVVIASSLGNTHGMNVFYSLRSTYKFGGRLMINGPQGSKIGTRCTPDELRKLLDHSIAIAPLSVSSYAPTPSYKATPSTSAKPKVVIGIDGWVRCPHTTGGLQCYGKQYVGDVGEYRCESCFRDFLAVAKEDNPKPASQILAPELKKATLAPDGWVQCPHIRCCCWTNAQNKPGAYTCPGCDEKFQAVANEAEIPKTPVVDVGQTLTAKAFNYFGDVHCPKCQRLIMNAVPAHKPEQVACDGIKCGITFTGEPFPDNVVAARI